MTTPPTTPPDRPTHFSTGQLLGVAAVACGSAAWLVQALIRDDDPASSRSAGPGSRLDPSVAPVRARLHAVVESDAVRQAEAKAVAYAPVAAAYRDDLAARAHEGSKRAHDLITAAEHRAQDLRQRAGKDTKKLRKDLDRETRQLRKDLDRETRHLRKTLGRDAEQLRKDLEARRRDVEKRAGRQRDQIRSASKSVRRQVEDIREHPGEVTHMANEHVRRLQERGAAAATGIAATLRDGGKDVPARAADVREQVVSLAQSSRKDLSGLIEDARDEANKRLPDLTKSVTERTAELGHQVADSASKASKVLSERAAEATERVPVGGDAVARAQSAVQDATGKAAAVVAPALATIGDRVSHLADDVRSDGGKTLSRAAGQGHDRLETLKSQASSVVKDLVPAGKDAQAVVSDRASQAKDRSADFGALLQGNLPGLVKQVSDFIDQAGDVSNDRLKDARKTGVRVAHEAEDQLDSTMDRLVEAAKRAAQVGDQAVAASSHLRGTTKNAAHKTADAGKDGLESLIWLGAAGVALYYGVLNPEQREKVGRVGMKAGRMVGKLITEVRGQDQKF